MTQTVPSPAGEGRGRAWHRAQLSPHRRGCHLCPLFLTELGCSDSNLGVPAEPPTRLWGGGPAQPPGEGFGTEQWSPEPRLGATVVGGGAEPPWLSPWLVVRGQCQVLSPSPQSREGTGMSSGLGAELSHTLAQVEGELKHGGSQALVDQVLGQATLWTQDRDTGL